MTMKPLLQGVDKFPGDAAAIFQMVGFIDDDQIVIEIW
jgi:hypothetical protein